MIQGIIMKASVEFRRGSASCSRRLAYQVAHQSTIISCTAILLHNLPAWRNRHNDKKNNPIVQNDSLVIGARRLRIYSMSVGCGIR
jgi:hypothetical protein